MKRIFTLLLLCLAVFITRSVAQTTNPCNAAFDYNITSGFTVHFTPVIVGDTPTVRHKWYFGDGTFSAMAAPTHTYATGGAYVVKHIFMRITPNGVFGCVDSTVKTVQLWSTNCNLVANFSSHPDSLNRLKINFRNLTTPSILASDSIRWTFGDGTASNDANPVHLYSQPGTYNVCLRVKRNITAGAPPCVSEICKTVTVVASSQCNLVANFSFQPDPLNSLKINFLNLSTPLAATDSIKWTFGDGTSSTAVNPSHTYTQPGTYTVCLRIKKPGSSTGADACVREICKLVTVGINIQCNLVANFQFGADPLNSLKIKFTNLSVPLASSDSIKWTFGDGTTSMEVNPLHLYAQPGVYNVCLRIKKNNSPPGTVPCVREICKTVTVIATNPCNLVASFTSHADSANGFKIYFHNTSIPLSPSDSIRWTFGDGTSSTAVNPVHIYATPGTYTVCLRIKKNNNSGTASCVREVCKTITVIATPPCSLVANFTHRVDPSHPNKIYFTNTSTPSTIANPFVKWSFGDGTYAYTWNADHVYAQPGTYQVCLRISISNTCVREICKVIVVTAQCDRQVNFSTTPDQSNPRKIHFNNLTPGTTTNATAKWTFGDGTTSTSWNAVHEYAHPGRYYVCLRVEFFPGCVKEKCDSITVAAPTNCQDISKWKSSKFSNDCLKFQFEPLQKNSAWQYHWTFGDGTGSHEMSPQHKYVRAGNYNVCLTVFKSLDCASTTCGLVQTGDCINCDSVRLKFEYSRTLGIPNRLSFTAVSNYPINSQIWTITKLPASISSPPLVIQQNNPVYTFPDTGYYLVCLKATVAGRCIKEYCEVIRIGELGGVCHLQAYPNPTHTIVNVNVQLTQPEMIHAYIYNTLNVLVREKHQQGFTGNNIVSINVETLVPGLYTMRVVYGNRVCYSQFQKF